jgi:hypothetical protein
MLIPPPPESYVQYCFLNEFRQIVESALTQEGYTTIHAFVDPNDDGSWELLVSANRASDQFAVGAIVYTTNFVNSPGFITGRHHYKKEIFESPHNRFLTENVGERSIAFAEGTEGLVRASGYSGPVEISVGMNNKGIRVNNEPVYPVEDYPRQFHLVESLYRLGISKAAGFGFAKVKAEGTSGENPYSLGEVGNLPNISIDRNLAGNEITVRRGAHRLVFHLGSTAAEFDGSTVTLDRPLMERHGEFYLPRPLIDRLRS